MFFLPLIILAIAAVVAAVAVGVTALASALKESRKDADKNFPAKPVCKTEEPCPLDKEKPNIVKIAWLDGAADKEVASGTQWVNLPHNAKWVDVPNNVPNIDRLSQKIRYKVTFSKPGGHSFKVKAEAGPTNAAYTGGEKGRNGNFKWLEEEKSYTTDGDGTKIVEADFFSTCAGMDDFKLKAEDTYGTPPVETGFMATKRLIYYVEVKMTGINAAPSLATMVSEFEKHGITLLSLGSVNMTAMENISTGDSNTFKANVKTAYTGSNGPTKAPYAIAVAYTGHLAVKNPSKTVTKSGVDVGPAKPAVVIPIVGPGINNPADNSTRYLWKGLVTGEGWYVSAKFIPADGTASVDIPEAKCTAVPESAGTPNRCNTVSVDVTGIATGIGSIELVVNWVDRMRGGLSFPGTNLICACTKAWWADKSAEAQNQVMIHEMGHQVNMVANGTGPRPDKVATHYEDSKGHVGDHCYNGAPDGQARYDASADATASICVMYGQTNGKTDFCGNCTPAVRKQDLSPGWTSV